MPLRVSADRDHGVEDDRGAKSHARQPPCPCGAPFARPARVQFRLRWPRRNAGSARVQGVRLSSTCDRDLGLRGWPVASTRTSTLLPRLAADGAGLVSIAIDARSAYIQFWRSVFERRAPPVDRPGPSRTGSRTAAGKCHPQFPRSAAGGHRPGLLGSSGPHVAPDRPRWARRSFRH